MSTQEDIQEMERNAAKAGQELEDILEGMPDGTRTELPNWWKKWYRKAGHKRLGRRFMEHADEGVRTL